MVRRGSGQPLNAQWDDLGIVLTAHLSPLAVENRKRGRTLLELAGETPALPADCQSATPQTNCLRYACDGWTFNARIKHHIELVPWFLIAGSCITILAYTAITPPLLGH